MPNSKSPGCKPAGSPQGSHLRSRPDATPDRRRSSAWRAKRKPEMSIEDHRPRSVVSRSSGVASSSGNARRRSAAAPYIEVDRIARLCVAHHRGELTRVVDGPAVGGKYDIASPDTGARGRAVAFNVVDQRTGRFRKLERFGECLIHILQRHAELRVTNLARAEDLLNAVLRELDRDRKRQALVVPAVRVDLRVDPDDRTACRSAVRRSCRG